MTDTVVVEGQWKSRWVALRKPSPVADCLLLLAYKDKADKTKGHKERSSVTLEDICGLEPVLSYEGISYTLAILCLTQAVMLGFDSRDTLLAWDARIRYSLGEVHRFSVGVLPGTKLESGPATLHLCNNLLGIARDLPPIIVGQWKLSDLRRYGAVPNGFVFEGGTRCGYWAGVFFLSCAEGEQISFLFDCIVRGISPSRAPCGLRPALPDPSADSAYTEERLDLEAQELEKRLSLLSHCSRQSGSASTYSYSASVAGDDRSISSSSSEASHSDTSIGSRLTMWAEPVISPTPVGEPLGPPTAKGTLLGEEKLYASAVGGARPPPKPTRSRRLQEIGRQSSSDSGIATGSHSSYSGSFSSYAGSIDTSQGDEFGSLLSLPPNLAPDQNLCICPPTDPAQSPGSEYQVPSSLKHVYDTPRSLFLGPPPKDQAPPPSLQSPGAEVKAGGDGRLGGALGAAGTDPILKWPAPQRQGQVPDTWSGDVAPPADPCEICSPQPGISRSLFAACPICGGLKGTMLTHSGVLSMPAIPECVKTAGVENKRPCQRRPYSRQSCEDLSSTKAAAARDPPATIGLQGNRPLEMLQRNNGTQLFQKNLHHSQRDTLGLHRIASHPSTKTGQQHVYEPMASMFRSGLRGGARSVRRSWGIPALVADRSFSLEGRQGKGGGNSQASVTKAPWDILSRCTVSSPPAPRSGNGIVPERTAMERGGSSTSASRLHQEVSGHSATEDDPKGSYELMASSVDTPKRFEPCPGEYGGVFVFPAEVSSAAGATDRPRGDGVTYVNIPISPTSKKQLHYMELELQEPGSGVRGGGSTKYAQIDITATETAHRVGTQHAQGREDRLQELEQKRKGAQP
ncbi:hypothetical protein JZ751_016505 [Albula glossodonta]|uniref:IRS-type PTB domain-containing protein n=1 Tax=Albula glossodonta TaxID=121402 RepID=A0A8T2NYJ2_9TELE|nr:hypothetical protein JZ751_016505 [Albula glossodonta]